MLYLSETISRRDLLLRVAAGATGLTLSSMAASAGAVARPQGLTALQEGVLIGGHAEEGVLWVSDNRGGLYASEDGGESWRVLNVRARGALTAMAVRRNLAVAVGHRGAVLTSQDRGWGWTPRSLPTAEPVSLLDVVVLPAGRVMAVGAFGACWASDDFGANWQALQPLAGDRHYNACAVDEQGVVVIVGEAGLLLRSADGGHHWTEVSSPVKSSLFSVLAIPSGGFLACGLGGAVLHSTNHGLTWTVVETGDKHSWYGASMLGRHNVMLAGNGGALCSLALDQDLGVTVRHRAREGYGSWSVVLSCQTKGASKYLLAVGETGVKRLYLSAWTQSESGGAA